MKTLDVSENEILETLMRHFKDPKYMQILWIKTLEI